MTSTGTQIGWINRAIPGLLNVVVFFGEPERTAKIQLEASVFYWIRTLRNVHRYRNSITTVHLSIHTVVTIALLQQLYHNYFEWSCKISLFPWRFVERRKKNDVLWIHPNWEFLLSKLCNSSILEFRGLFFFQMWRRGGLLQEWNRCGQTNLSPMSAH